MRLITARKAFPLVAKNQQPPGMSKPPCTISIDFDRLDALLRRALVFNHIDDAMIVTTLEGIIVDWNIGAERIFGWRREQALNATFEIFLAPNAPRLIRQILDTVAKKGRWADELNFVRRDGAIGQCEAVSVPLLDGTGETRGILNVFA